MLTCGKVHRIANTHEGTEVREVVELLRRPMVFLGSTFIEGDHSNDDLALLEFNTLL